MSPPPRVRCQVQTLPYRAWQYYPAVLGPIAMLPYRVSSGTYIYPTTFQPHHHQPSILSKTTMATKQGCVFCGEVARKCTTINIHLDQYVPEIAKARKIKLLTDEHHHVGIIRHGRYPVRAKWVPKNQPRQKDWKLANEPLLRTVLTEFGKRMIVPVEEKVCEWCILRFGNLR